MSVSDDYKIVCIGVSAGAFKALTSLLSQLPADFPAAVVVVCHRLHSPDNYLTEYLSDICAMQVHDIEHLDRIAGNKIYIAPPDYHVLIAEDYMFNLSVDVPVNYSRPSIDVLFETAAEVYGDEMVAVVLTGANQDGAAGLSKVLAAGGYAIVQDPESAESRFMPDAALKNNQVHFIGSLDDISQHLCDIFSVKRLSHAK